MLELTEQLGKALKKKSWLLTTAESCTGGGIAETVTSIPGSSQWFDRGFVCYSNTAKQEMLGVSTATLTREGAVSEATAKEMAEGALNSSQAQIAVSTTGIAGPEGGFENKPIGTVWIAFARRDFPTQVQHHLFHGDRQTVRAKTVQVALEGLLALCKEPVEEFPPVITFDGPSGTGKGTISRQLAKKLGWHYLDSGSLYRILAYSALLKSIDLENEAKLQDLAYSLDAHFTEEEDTTCIFLSGENITSAIRTEQCGITASKIAVLPLVRHALLEKQRAFRQWPGLVTDGRDMGTVIFPDANLKFFLQATSDERAKRRFNQLKKQGVHASLAEILRDLIQRDARDQERNTAPLKPADDALVIDTTHLDVEQVLSQVMQPVEILVQSWQ